MNDIINRINDVIVNICHLLAMVVIFVGIIKSMIIYVKDIMFTKESYEALQESSMEIGHSFSLGLAFLIGASILRTIIAPTWTDIGMLASIIAIRTALNFFLIRDVENIFKK